MQRTIYASLGAISQELARFLGSHLPLIGGENWWQTHVVSQLTYGQQGQVRTRGIDRPGGLDLAALIRVFDRNWAELSYQSKLPDELRTHVRELADIRNATSHTAAEGEELSPHDAYRYLDTMARVLKGLSADSAVMVPIETARTEVMRAMADAVAPAIEPVIEIREVPVEVIKEVIREVPVEVIREVRVHGPSSSEKEPEGGLLIGRLRLHGPGEEQPGKLSGFDGKEADATLIPWAVYGDGGLHFSIQVAMIDEGTANEVGQVVCTSRNQSPQVWDDVVQRLRIGIRDAGEGQWIMDLRSVERPKGSRAGRKVWTLQEYQSRAGINLQQTLTSLGAIAVDTRATLLNDKGKNRNFAAMLFEPGDSRLPAVAWALTTLAPLL